MTGLFLAPATNRKGAYTHFQQTMLNGVPQEIYSDLTSKKLDSPAYVWGLTSSIKSTWSNVDHDDWVLFYTQENEYEYAAQILEKEHNPDLGNRIRERLLEDVSNERDWDYLLFFDDPVPVSVSGDTVAGLLDYGNRFPVRFIRVTNERLKRLKSEYRSVEEFVSAIQE